METEKGTEEKLVELVDTGWLEERLSDEELMIVDCQPNIHDYIQEHIPGAVYFNPDLFRVPFEGTPGSYIPMAAAKMLFDRAGIENDVETVVYTGVGPFKGWGDGLEQTMVAYSLSRFGHNKVRVLDGGIDKWKAEKKKVEKEFPKITGSDFRPNVRREYFIGYNEFKGIKDEREVVVLDARPEDLYSGQGPWQKPGHIPGAINLPWKSLMEEDNPTLLKPLEGIRERLEKMGIDPYKEMICTCGTGREATNEFLLFKYYLNYPKVRLYEGSFTEWTSHPENPTVIGPDPR